LSPEEDKAKTRPPAYFDPIANSFSQVGSMATARRGHSGVVLPGGKVLVSGDNNNRNTLP
jgi:hypothetical protein